MKYQTLLHRAEDTALYRKFKFLMNRQLIAFFEEHIFNKNKSLKVAEFAAGSGFGANLISNYSSVDLSIAVDISQELFNPCVHRKFDAGYVTADIFQLPFRQETFDFVWNSSSLEHFKNPEKVLAIMSAFTKKGGFIFAGVPYFYGPLFCYHLIPFREIREWLGPPFTMGQLEMLFQKTKINLKASKVYFGRLFVGILGVKAFDSP